MSEASFGVKAQHPSAGHFYARMAMVALVVAVAGFAPTYFMPILQGKFAAPPVVHVHAALFFGWTVFFCWQTWLVSSGRMRAHREWGLLGISLATAMVFAVFATASAMIHLRAGAGYGEAALAFSWVQIGGIVFFAALIGIAIANIDKPETHKRLMLLATISLLDAPIARWVLVLSGPPMPAGVPPPPPVSAVVLPSLIADLLLLMAIAYDWRSRGRPHRVYIVGGAILVALQVSRPWVSETAMWRAVAGAIAGLGG